MLSSDTMNSLMTKLIFGLALLIAVLAVVGNQGLLHLQNIENELNGLSGKNRELEAGIVQTQEQLYKIHHSKLELEKHAREELGLSKPGEIVYIAK